MSFIQDQFSKIMAYFDTEDVEDETNEQEEQRSEEERFVSNQPSGSPIPQARLREETTSVKAVNMANPSTVSSLNQREQTTPPRPPRTATMSTIDIKFPKKYEEARDIVNLLINNVSILIDFQHMTDSQARRCIDYLDGARFVIQGNLKKISSTMWLLTPANVVVNIEEMALRGEARDANYDYDMKRR